MSKHVKLIIIEIVWLVILVLLITTILMHGADLKIFKILTLNQLSSEVERVEKIESNMASVKTNYESNVKSLENAKQDFEREKDAYSAISEETIKIINESFTSESYNIEYMWVKLGTYAKKNNLALSLIEPGGTHSSESTTEDNTENTSKPVEDSTNNSSGGNTQTAVDFTVKITGSYLNISDFVFDVENDDSLRFKLDNINMKYEGNNQVSVTFVVKKLAFKK